MLRRGIDIRYVVTSLQGSDAEHICETIYCARGQAENLIKRHKAQLSSDRTSCRSPLANQMRLILHTGAYWLLLDLRNCNPELESAAAHRVRHDSSASLEDRQPFHRACEPHSYRARLMLPGGRDIQSCRAQAATVWTISQRGDDAPPSPDPFTPNASTALSTQPICRAWRAQNGRACLAKTRLQIMRPRA
jgi:Transposase DDE domain group 1